MTIKLAPNLTLPKNAVTQTFAFLARKGAGKTYSAGKLVEGLLEVGAQVIVLDPVGNWYGLRLSANGKSAGFAIPVFGGEHGDIPLESTQGEVLGKLVVDRNLSTVIDVSLFRKAERKRFVADFAEALFHHAKTSRTPRMLVLEEAQTFAPQNVQKGEERMLGAIEDIVRLGRNYGIGSAMISQRPQSINKEVLNQCECLFVGQLNAVHERKAIEGWLVGHKGEKGWTDELPSLPVGTMFVWSPQWLNIMQKVKISKKVTYDASATPELGGKVVTPKELQSTFDLEELKAALAPPPPEKKKGAAPARAQEDNQAQEQLEVLRSAFMKERAVYASLVSSVSAELGRIAAAMTGLADKLQMHPALADSVKINTPTGPVEAKSYFLNERQELPATVRDVRVIKKERTPPWPKGYKSDGAHKSEEPASALQLKKGAQRMIEALAAFYPGKMTKAQIARAADMTPSGGAFNDYWSALNREALLQRVGQDSYVATKQALEALGQGRVVVPQDQEARITFWQQRLKPTEAKMLRLVADYTTAGIGITRAGLAESVGMTSSGGAFNAAIGTLVRNRLVAKESDLLKIHPWLAGKE